MSRALVFRVTGHTGFDVLLSMLGRWRWIAKRCAKQLSSPGEPYHGARFSPDLPMQIQLAGGAFDWWHDECGRSRVEPAKARVQTGMQ